VLVQIQPLPVIFSMIKLSPDQIAQYLHRSYTTVDGLWFIKAEEALGFDAALRVDYEAWMVMLKIQARMLKAMGNNQDGIEALYHALTGRQTLDGFIFTTERTDDGRGFRLIITHCPWHDRMIDAGRKHLHPSISDLICTAGYQLFAAEFGSNIRYELECQLCKGAPNCIMKYTEENGS